MPAALSTGCILARCKLPHGRADLSTGQSAARSPAQARRHQTSPARALGHHHHHRAQLHYVHLNRLIKEHDLNMIYVIGPGHGGPGMVAHSYLEGSYTERFPNIERSRNGMQRLFRQSPARGSERQGAERTEPSRAHLELAERASVDYL
jgi:phosphoketolase